MGPDNRRILVATVASVAILIVWQVLFPPKRPPPPRTRFAPQLLLLRSGDEEPGEPVLRAADVSQGRARGSRLS